MNGEDIINSGDKKDLFLKPHHIHVMLNPVFKLYCHITGESERGNKRPAHFFLKFKKKTIIEKEEELSVIFFLFISFLCHVRITKIAH